MALDEVPRVTQIQSGRNRPGYFEKDIYANGEIGAEDEARPGTFNQMTDLRNFIVPTCGAYHHGAAGAHAGGDIFKHRMGSGEVDDYIGIAQSIVRERLTCDVLGAGDGAHVMTALLRDICKE